MHPMEDRSSRSSCRVWFLRSAAFCQPVGHHSSQGAPWARESLLGQVHHHTSIMFYPTMLMHLRWLIRPRTRQPRYVTALPPIIILMRLSDSMVSDKIQRRKEGTASRILAMKTKVCIADEDANEGVWSIAPRRCSVIPASSLRRMYRQITPTFICQ
ncbi:hypothetical protein BDR07DRAFT_1394027 [Suillus spraguei]|nr:hypothetical protein BDR07DRAFT_1394027 [Suillus spraguei]